MLPSYPDVLIRDALVKREGGVVWRCVSIATSLRKKYRGKYYLWDHIQKGVFEPENTQGKDSLIITFYREVYKTMILGIVDLKINPKFKEMYNKDMFVLDNDQRSEEERLKNQLY